jgi:hypothetical protein
VDARVVGTGECVNRLALMNRVLSAARGDDGRDVHVEVGRELHENVDANEWCAAWARMILKRVGFRSPPTWDWVDSIRTAASQAGVYHQGLHGVREGDLLIHGTGSSAHVGFALGPYQNGVVHSIAGNSGGGVVAERYIGQTGPWHWDGYVDMHPFLDGVLGWDHMLSHGGDWIDGSMSYEDGDGHHGAWGHHGAGGHHGGHDGGHAGFFDGF